MTSARPHIRAGFTLIELLIVIGLIGVLASFVIVAINPQSQLGGATNASRRSAAVQLEKAEYQFLIDNGRFAVDKTIPQGQEAALPICRATQSDAGCINVDQLAPTHLPCIPYDTAEPNAKYSGFKIYLESGRVGVFSAYVGSGAYAGGCTRVIAVKTSVDTAGSTGQYTAAVIGTDGYPVVSYYDASNGDLRTATCADSACVAGTTFNSPDTTGSVGQYTSIALGSDGFPVVAYYDVTNLDLKFLKCADASCTAGGTISSLDTSGSVGLYVSLAIGTDGFPVISYYNTSSLDLKVIKCGNAACTSGNTTTSVDTTGSVGQYTGIAVGSDNLPVVSYFNTSTSDLKITKCGNAACTSGNTTTSVDTTGSVGQYTSVSVGSDNLPVVSYYDVTNGNLKVLKCGNTTCSSGNTITAVDTPGNVGLFTDVALLSGNIPVVSYYDSTNADLKIAKCGNASCTTSTITSADTANSVGQYTSIVVGSDNLPVVSYYDVTNLDLKVMHCADAGCTLQ